MVTRQIGRTSLHVTRLGLGTGPLGGWPTVVPADQAIATIERAWQLGIRYFDTAPMYGHGLSEEHLSAVLPSLTRDQFVLSTKVGRLLVPGIPDDPLFDGVLERDTRFDFSADGTLRSLVESRARLGLDAIDIALIHDPDDHHEEALSGAYETLAELREEGTIKAVGVGMNWSGPLSRFILERDFDCMLLAGRYTLLEQDALDDVLPAAIDRNVSILAAAVYNSGLLIDPGPDSYYNYERAPEVLIERARELRDACLAFDVPLRLAAIQFPLHHSAVACVVVGARSPEEVEENVRMLETPIPPELWVHLKERGLVRADAPTPD